MMLRILSIMLAVGLTALLVFPTFALVHQLIGSSFPHMRASVDYQFLDWKFLLLQVARDWRNSLPVAGVLSAGLFISQLCIRFWTRGIIGVVIATLLFLAIAQYALYRQIIWGVLPLSVWVLLAMGIYRFIPTIQSQGNCGRVHL